MTEIWKDIQGYEGLYQVSNLGRVKSLARILNDGRIWKEKIIKPAKSGSGYMQVTLYKNNIKKPFRIHRLVAEAFIPNPLNLPFVNHKDENKANNFVGTPENNYTDGNLEWCTREYNINYGTAIERISKTKTGIYNTKKSKTVLQLEKDGSLVRIWPSVREVERQLGYKNSNIAACCRGRYHSIYGFKWCYAKQ